ncbi:hypothetical protein [Oceanithermus sp.]
MKTALLLLAGGLLSYWLSRPSRPWEPLQAIIVAAAYVFGLSLGAFASGGSLQVALLAGVASGALFGYLNRRLVLGGLNLNAAERLAFKLAWRRGGLLSEEDLTAAGLDPDTARNLLADLEARGLCRRDGEVCRFER